MKLKTITIDKMIDLVIQRAVQQTDSASEREQRDRDWDENNQMKESDNQMIDEKKENKDDIW